MICLLRGKSTMRSYSLKIISCKFTFLGIPRIRSKVPPNVPAMRNKPVSIAAPYALEDAPTSEINKSHAKLLPPPPCLVITIINKAHHKRQVLFNKILQTLKDINGVEYNGECSCRLHQYK